LQTNPEGIFINNLNSEQRAAVQAPSGHNLVIASAGTGKTSTIVGRIVHLLEHGIRPEKILLLTFTNKAAGEMLARLEAYFPKETLNLIESGTFHAVCFKWLKEIYPRVSLKQPGELKTLFRSIYETFSDLCNADDRSLCGYWQHYGAERFRKRHTCQWQKSKGPVWYESISRG